MISAGRGRLAAAAISGLIAAGCGTHDTEPAWRPPAIGDGTEAQHVRIVDGTTDGSTSATVHSSYRCPSTAPMGGEITAILAIASSGASSTREKIPVTCDGVEHAFDVQFDGAFPAGDLMVYGDFSMQLPKIPATTIPSPIPGGGGIGSSLLLNEVAGDHAHILSLKTVE